MITIRGTRANGCYVLIVALAIAIALGVPASASQPEPLTHRSVPIEAICSGISDLQPGKLLLDSVQFSWSFDSDCQVVTLEHGVEVATVHAQGTGEGNCLNSIGEGSWELVFKDGQVVQGELSWTHGLSALAFSGTHDAGGMGTLTGGGQATPRDPGACVGDGADEFEVDFVAELS